MVSDSLIEVSQAVVEIDMRTVVTRVYDRTLDASFFSTSTLFGHSQLD